METELVYSLRGSKRQSWEALLRAAQLEPDDTWESTVLLWDNEQLIAAASRQGNLLKCIAVDPMRQGEGLTATLLTQLRQDAFADGHRHLRNIIKSEQITFFRRIIF